MAVFSRDLIVCGMLALGLSAGACKAGNEPMPTIHAPKSASLAPLSVEEVVGFWRIGTGSGSGDCLIALNRLREGSGYGLHIETCGISVLSSAAEWRLLAGGFELREKSGAVIASFQMIDVDHFSSPERGYLMERAAIR